MKNKIISLFENQAIIKNQGAKYSVLLEQFIEPFAADFSDSEYYEEIFEFAISAWNFGNMKLLLPKGESEAFINSIKAKGLNVDLLKRMIYAKEIKFKEYTNFIVDYEIKEGVGDPILSVITQEQDAYLAKNMDAINNNDFEENCINRSAIVLKPLQPFLDWISNLYPEEVDEIIEINTYLVSDDIDDKEAWLKKEFDRLFILELDDRCLSKKDWPKKRTYKMFKQWFQIDISTVVYDLEKEPVQKL